MYDGVTHIDRPNWIEPIVIVLIILLNAVFGIIQEQKAEAALAALKDLSAPMARAVRDGTVLTVPSLELVPGDMVELEAGDVVPADCRLTECFSLTCDESALTGESVPVQKNADTVAEGIAPLGDRFNMVYAGCPVTYGRGRAAVVETAMNTEAGKIAAMLEGEGDITPLQRKLAQFGKYLGFLSLAVCAVIFFVGLLEGLRALDMFMAAVALAVAAIPEGLPAVVTVVLAMGVRKMVAKNAVIRRLPAVEALGGASVICTDKTGTLTQNRMMLVRAFTNKMIDLADADNQRPAVHTLIQLAGLCSDGNIQIDDGVEKPVGDPTEAAIVSYARRLGMVMEELRNDFPRLGEIPFDSERKLMTTVHLVADRKIVIVKGAPDILLSRCSAGNIELAKAANEEMGREALRVLAVGFKYIEEVPDLCVSDEMENGLTFAGLLGMIDPPRPEAVAAIRECQSAGIQTVMITGDHVTTAAAIARQLGILTDDGQAVTGAELSAMDDAAFGQNIRRYRVYARVAPADKLRIVKAWQQAGETVAMTGDGVNDAPALKAADIGCAMGRTGTEVAKSAADMVLTDDNFATVVTAVREGRGIYGNIRKAVQFLLSCNLGEVIVMFLGLLFWREAPLVAVQLLWINLVTDSLPALALGMEPPERGVMKQPPRRAGESFFSHGVGLVTVLQGVLIGALSLIAFVIGFQPGSATVATPDAVLTGETMAFATLAISQLIHAFNVRTSRSVFRAGVFKNKYMNGAFLISLALMVLALTLPFMHSVFKIVAMTPGQWSWVIGLSLTPLAVCEAVKAVLAAFRKRR